MECLHNSIILVASSAEFTFFLNFRQILKG